MTPTNLIELPGVPQFVPWVAAAVIGLAVLVVTWWQLRRGLRLLLKVAKRHSAEDNLTIVAATIATGVSATGMWRFFENVLHLPWPLRIVLFAFIEVAVVTSAVRAKRSMRENFSAGIDGIAVWVLAVLTAFLSAMHSESFPEVVFRLSSPLVSAWLWERGMRLERRRLRGTSGIHWRLTPERVLVRLGIAEARDRSAADVDAHRRLTRVALAAKRAKALRERGASERKVRAAMARLDRRLDQAVAHTGLAQDERMQWALLDQVTTLFGGASLTTLPDTPTWAHLDHPAVTGAAKHREAAQLAEAMNEWTAAINTQRDPETSAAIKSMAAYIARLEGRPTPRFETADETVRSVDVEVSEAEIDDLIDRLREEPPPPSDETGDETEDETRATEAMWAYWQKIVQEERRLPTGTELANVGKCTPQYGARKAREWSEAMDGRTRRALRPGKKAST
ncbi:hypothetical protein [Nonomuraea typhae]|uniref:hypothetical protein n=1 Tax=Nonomuraea typhae TaxID=2603600 RepID=UPI0012FC2B00|nr:hypothetical protein [Nonomuraea typhae]